MQPMPKMSITVVWGGIEAGWWRGTLNAGTPASASGRQYKSTKSDLGRGKAIAYNCPDYHRTAMDCHRLQHTPTDCH